jgi:hypothetical protein
VASGKSGNAVWCDTDDGGFYIFPQSNFNEYTCCFAAFDEQIVGPLDMKRFTGEQGLYGIIQGECHYLVQQEYIGRCQKNRPVQQGKSKILLRLRHPCLIALPFSLCLVQRPHNGTIGYRTLLEHAAQRGIGGWEGIVTD